MNFSDLTPGLDEAVFDHLADAALWNGSAVRIILREADEVASYGDSRAILSSRVIEVRKSDVPNPVVGDAIVLGARNFSVLADPMIDELGTVWSCEVEEL